MKKETFSLIFVPHDIKKTRTIRVPYPLLYVMLTLLGVGFVLMVVFIATYGRLLIRAQEVIMLEKQVAELTRRQETMNEIMRNMSRIRSMDRQIRNMLGVDVASGDSIPRSPHVPYRNGGGGNLEEQEQILQALPSFWPVRGYITRGFSVAGKEGDPQYHPGLDIAVERGIPVRAAAAGIVVEGAWNDTYGYYVVIDHGYGIKTLYGHNDRLVVMNGERVGRGQTIAYSGNTGRSTAPHLHFAVMRNGVYVDPLEYLLQ